MCLIHCQHFLYKTVCLWHLEYKLAMRIQRPQSWRCRVSNDRCCLVWPQLQKSRWSNLRAFQQKKFELKQACLLLSSFSCTKVLCCLPTPLPDRLPMLLIWFVVLPTIPIFIFSKIFFPFHLCLSCYLFPKFLIICCTLFMFRCSNVTYSFPLSRPCCLYLCKIHTHWHAMSLQQPVKPLSFVPHFIYLEKN